MKIQRYRERPRARYQAPRTIANHPGVKECLDADGQGFDGYRHDVELKDGWRFTRGRMEGCQSARFNTVAEFRAAGPMHGEDA